MPPSATWRPSVHGRANSSWQNSSRLSDQAARSDPLASRRSCSAGDRARDHTKARRSLVNLWAASRAILASSRRRSVVTHPTGIGPTSNSSARGSRCGQSPQVKSISSPSTSSKRERQNGHRPFVPHCPVRKTPADRGWSGAIEHTTGTEVRLAAESRNARWPIPARSRQSPPIEPVNLIDRTTRQISALMSSGTTEREPTIMWPSFDRPLFTALAAWRPFAACRRRPWPIGYGFPERMVQAAASKEFYQECILSRNLVSRPLSSARNQ